MTTRCKFVIVFIGVVFAISSSWASPVAKPKPQVFVEPYVAPPLVAPVAYAYSDYVYPSVYATGYAYSPYAIATEPLVVL
ncbi:hypothetical protein ABEB36_001287 [Hypothenemus hampei]|uniref:Neuropeptide-like 4 n=1 Tax=Hypothenemus hampei TaxID=57062 RepID=A0ABD1FE24_HYPHA